MDTSTDVLTCKSYPSIPPVTIMALGVPGEVVAIVADVVVAFVVEGIRTDVVVVAVVVVVVVAVEVLVVVVVLRVVVIVVAIVVEVAVVVRLGIVVVIVVIVVVFIGFSVVVGDELILPPVVKNKIYLINHS